ncbi:MAG: polysaccharide pyruvyl transferase family protein [Lachnospiraceae bacterium]|nr:polysaccharide pyruvyl transferase family protein [Lachnospiraceae bacterium]
MKIGILTLHESSNFGACLQAVATYKTLNGLGYDCEFINYTCAEIARREILLGTLFEHSLFYRLRVRIKHGDSVRKQRALSQFLRQTDVQKGVIGSERYNRKNIGLANDKYDIFLVGSDMLWCTKFTNADYTYMLDFVKDDTKKFSYATSVGYYWGEEEKLVLKYLDKFTMLSVRENDMACKLSEVLNIKVYEVCDPTMLIEPDIWKKYISSSKPSKKTYSLVYVDLADGRCLEAACAYSRQNGCLTYLLGYKKTCRNAQYKLLKAYTVEEFLTAIYHADILYTSSYHGMLFAIYFHVPFVYYNKDSSRLECIAKKLNLTTRNGDNYNVGRMDAINWDEVDRLRENFRIESLSFIKEMGENWAKNGGKAV